MTSKLVRLWWEVKQGDKSPEEIIEELTELNQQIDWCFAQMIDEVTEEQCTCRGCSEDEE